MATTALIDYSKTYAEMQDGSSKENKMLIAKAVTAMFYMLKNQECEEELHEENAMEMCRLALVELKKNLRPEYTDSQLLEGVIQEPELFYKTGIKYMKHRFVNFMMEKN